MPLAQAPARKPHSLVCLEDLEEGQIRWLWHPYIPYGCASLIFGPGGVGKSHIVVDLATRITLGSPFPHAKAGRKPGNVLIMSAEDDPAEVLKPRLRAAGADMKRVFCPDEEFVLDKAGLREMEGFMEECTATVVFIDPIVAFMGGKIDMFKANEVRSLMQPLNKAAQRTGTALVIVGHERKNKGGSLQDNSMGSADFVNAARSTLYVVEDKLGTGMFHVKCNYAAKGEAISFSFDKEKDRIMWGDFREEPEPVFGGSKWGQGGDGEDRPVDIAQAFLVAILKDGPMLATEVQGLAKDQGIKEHTLNRAKSGIAESFMKREEGKAVWYWRLIGQED